MWKYQHDIPLKIIYTDQYHKQDSFLFRFAELHFFSQFIGKTKPILFCSTLQCYFISFFYIPTLLSQLHVEGKF